jgi:phytoene dehydrogenase-like protein
VRTIVVGAGLGGLSAACHLAGRGHEVVVIDREAVPGGRAGLVEEEGFRIDSGPTVLTMVGLLEATFVGSVTRRHPARSTRYWYRSTAAILTKCSTLGSGWTRRPL